MKKSDLVIMITLLIVVLILIAGNAVNQVEIRNNRMTSEENQALIRTSACILKFPASTGRQEDIDDCSDKYGAKKP